MYIFFKAVVIIMCDFFQVIKNTFFCYVNISQPFRYLSTCLSVYLSIYLSIHPSIHPSIYLSIHLSKYIYIKNTNFNISERCATSKVTCVFHTDIFWNCIPLLVYVCVWNIHVQKFSISYKFTIKKIV